jgi:L-methionine (R)-S-oxide reductase
LQSFNKENIFRALLSDINNISSQKSDKSQKLWSICKLLQTKISYYNWVGFYLVDPASPQELVLGPYVGEPTEHSRIPFGKGICGQAASQEKTFIVQDVSKENNYLSCSLDVKSEIVVPIFKNGKIIGELDIDSHDLEPFDENDNRFLDKVCGFVSIILG